jgi:hypothetical protein
LTYRIWFINDTDPVPLDSKDKPSSGKQLSTNTAEDVKRIIDENKDKYDKYSIYKNGQEISINEL